MSALLFAAVCLFSSLALLLLLARMTPDPQHRWFRVFIAGAMTAGTFGHAGKFFYRDALPDGVVLALLLVVACGTLATFAVTHVAWRSEALDDLLTTSSVILVVASALTWFRLMTLPAAVYGVTQLMTMLWLVCLIRRMAQGRLPYSTIQAAILWVYSGLLLAAYSCSLVSDITGWSWPFQLGQCAMLIGMLLIGAYMTLRTRLKQYAPKKIQPQRSMGIKPHWLGLAAITAALSMVVYFQAPDTLMLTFLVFLAVLALVIRHMVTLSEFSLLRTNARNHAANYRMLVQNSSDVIIICNPNTLRTTYISPAADQVLGLPAHQVHGDPLPSIVGAPWETVTTAIDTARGSGTAIRVTGHSGQNQLEAIISSHKDQIIATVRDVTEREQLRTELRQLAFVDPLTGLDNRHQITTTLARLLQSSPTEVALLFVDLNSFKQINDASGHEVGDAVLAAVATRFAHAVEPHGHIGRLGGDEFVSIINTRRADPTRVATDLLASLHEPFLVRGKSYRLGASIGVATASVGVRATELLRQADTAMYAAKRRRRPLMHYEPALTTAAIAESDRDNTVAAALSQRRFSVFAQPVVTMANQRVVAAESLVRWHDASGQLHGPGELIDYASRTGELGVVTRWVLSSALTYMSTSGTATRMAVNVPPQELLEGHLPDMLGELLTQTGIHGDRVVVEVTEDSILDQTQRSARVLNALHDLGVRVMIDDFGTGYSSLAYLVDLPIDGLKIDRRFITDLSDRPAVQSIVRSLVHIATDNQWDLVAEGVETAAESTILMDLGCTVGQGFFFGRPQLLQSCQDMSGLHCWHSGQITLDLPCGPDSGHLADVRDVTPVELHP